MAEIKVRNMSGAEVSDLTLSDAVFAVEVNEAALHMAGGN